MPKLGFINISKSFGDFSVIEDFSAEIPDEEFLVLLGPSGCGKSTMLRMIAGLTDITSGTLTFDDTPVNDLEPKDRGVAFVFQSYALYPHMTVRANIAFPLLMSRFRWYHHLPLINTLMRRRFLRDPSIQQKVEAIAGTMNLLPHLDHRPKTLSGGQRQRVAVARALVRDPSLYLLDEPLSNLDAQLRTQMRAEIASLYQRVRKTFIYVTHDQVEAMTMGTRIIVMNNGKIQQSGTPRAIYDTPANTFVATFIGTPPMNLFPGPVVGAPDTVRAGIRPEKIAISPTPTPMPAQIAVVEHLGAETIAAFTLPDTQTLYYARMPGDHPFSPGTPCWINLDLNGMSWFDAASGDRVRYRDQAGSQSRTGG